MQVKARRSIDASGLESFQLVSVGPYCWQNLAVVPSKREDATSIGKPCPCFDVCLPPRGRINLAAEDIRFRPDSGSMTQHCHLTSLVLMFKSQMCLQGTLAAEGSTAANAFQFAICRMHELDCCAAHTSKAVS